MTSTRCVRLTLAACLVAAPALAQTDSPRVSDLLAPGQTIEVIDDQGRETKGRVEVVSANQSSWLDGWNGIE